MGVYRKYKSQKDPQKFLEKFSKNITGDKDKKIMKPEPVTAVIEDRKYEVPPPRAAMEYETLKKKCQELLLDIIKEEDFRNILASDKDKLKKLAHGFDNFKFNTKGLSWERELQIKNLFIKSLKEYKKGLDYFEGYLESKKKKDINSGIKLITSAGERLDFIKSLAEKGRKDIIEDMKKYLDNLSGEEKEESLPSCDSPSEIAPISEPFVPPHIENTDVNPLQTPAEIDKKNISLLRAFNLFEGLEDFQLEDIFEFIKTEIYEKEYILYEEGMKADNVYLVLNGDVILYKSLPHSPEDKEVIAFIERGEILGDMGIIDNGPRATNARIVSENLPCS